MKLTDFLKSILQTDNATDTGTAFHKKMQFVVVDDEHGDKGDKEIIENIRSHPDLMPYFVASAKTEVPIAGEVDGKFWTMRIDRLLIDDKAKEIVFVDYKTDTNKTERIDHYKEQFYKYATLLRSAYPEYKVTGYILWKQDWTLDKLI